TPPSVSKVVRVSVRADGSSGNQDFPWRAVIRSEMETWVPERLPAHFRPRRSGAARTARSSLARGWCTVALAVAALVMSAMAYAQGHAASRVPTVVQLLLGTSVRATPAAPVPQDRPPAAPATTEPRPTVGHRRPVVA